MPHIATPRRRMVVGGRELDLTAKQVLDKMRNVEPEPVRDHLVEIGSTQVSPQASAGDRHRMGPAELHHHGSQPG